MIRKAFKILIPVFLALPLVLYISIVITNNWIANKIEKELVVYKLPESTVLVDSLSVAGKLTGNGNGMQYMGSILIESDFREDELREHYCSGFDYIEVRRQETANIDFIHPRNYSFSDFSKTDGKVYYSITCWDSNRREIFGDFIAKLLDFDFRGY